MRPTKQNSDTKTNKVHKPGMRFTVHKPHKIESFKKKKKIHEIVHPKIYIYIYTGNWILNI